MEHIFFVGGAGVLAAAFALCYAGVLTIMVSQWWTNDIYSYGFLIPCISLYLIWVRREQLKQIALVPDFPGGITIVTSGLLMLILGHAGKVLLVEELSLIITLAGVVILILGRGFLQALLFPIMYLLFMLPIWDVITDRLHLPFQIISSTIGLTLLQAVGIPAYRQGTFIELPNVTLEVAQVCSGVNYLIAIVAIGIPIGYLFLRGWMKRTLLVGIAVVIAILSNGLRIALIGTLSHYGLSGDTHGPFHMLQGMFVSVIGYAALFGGVWILSPSPSSTQERKNDTIGSARSKPPRWAFSKGVILLSAVFLLTGSYIHFYHPIPIHLKADLKDFPYEITGWTGSKTSPNPSLLGQIEAKETLSRVYRNASGDQVNLYIGYFESQEQGKKLVSYKTDRLFQNVSEVEVRVDRHRMMHVNKQILQEEDGRRLILFWYELNGKIITDFYLTKLYMMWDALAHRRNNGAIILLSIDVTTLGDLEHSLSVIEQLIPEIFPVLANYLPEGSRG